MIRINRRSLATHLVITNTFADVLLCHSPSPHRPSPSQAIPPHLTPFFLPTSTCLSSPPQLCPQTTLLVLTRALKAWRKKAPSSQTQPSALSGRRWWRKWRRPSGTCCSQRGVLCRCGGGQGGASGGWGGREREGGGLTSVPWLSPGLILCPSLPSQARIARLPFCIDSALPKDC